MKTRFFRSALPLSAALLIVMLSACVKAERLPAGQGNMPDQNRNHASNGEAAPWLPEPQEPELTARAARPSGPLELTVEEAIASAMANNRDLKIEQLHPEISGTLATIERGVYDPELFAEMAVFEEQSSAANEDGSRSTVKENGSNGQIGLRQKLASGTLVEASVGHDKSDTSSAAPDQMSRLGLTVTQSLLRGFGPTVNLVRLRQAQLETAVSTSELRAISAAILAETEISYWDYVLAGQKIVIFEHSLAVARQQLDEIEQRIEVGSLPRIEAAAAHAEVARREQALIDMRSNLEERRLRLLRLINPGSRGHFDLQIRATSTADINPLPVSDLADRLLLAEKSRPELAEARLRLRQHRLETIMTRNGLLPRLELFINLAKTGYADSFSDAFKNLEENNHDYRAGIKLSHYLHNRQAEARDLAARFSERQAKESVANLRELIDLDVRLAVNEFERSRQQISATRVTRRLQDETLAAEKERFNVGVSTALLVAQAQRDLLASAIDEAEAIINCRKALIKLYLAEGSLLGRRGIQVADAGL